MALAIGLDEAEDLAIGGMVSIEREVAIDFARLSLW